jgi:AraC family transcriptional regulator of adaptative response/methylated-DNA-[protein]-cysteine methyltransferase
MAMTISDRTQDHGAVGPVRFSIGNSALGRVLVAATERGICAIKLGSNAAELEADLRREFPQATVHRDDRALAEALRTVLAQTTERPIRTVLPLDIRGTTFQQRVWQALQQIPCGQTRSYAQMAIAIGQPKAVRTVARACAQNPVAVLVPCHRVLGSNGKLTGYRWGLERKQKLLQIEACWQPSRSGKK